MIDRLIIAGHADHTLLKEAVHRLKYKYDETLATTLADWMIGAIASNIRVFDISFPLIIPVPLHVRRMRERGFNQSELLAKHISKMIALSYEPRVLMRTRYTNSQVKTHSRWERMENMREAFICPDASRCADRDIILIDDVCTTGATLEACAEALKGSGARSVVAFVLARG